MQKQSLHHPGRSQLFKAGVLESVVFLLILASVGLIVISSCIVHGRMLQENEEVHQMSSDNNQKTETRYVCCSYCQVLWEGSCTVLV